MNKILEIKNLSKNYQTIKGEIKAIDNISFALDNEEVLCIVGSSGCGKSTLLNILAGLDNKTSGEIKIKDGCTMGYMLQDDALFPWLNILDNACLGLDIKKIKTKKNIEFVNSDFREFAIETNENTLVYCDPPYFLGTASYNENGGWTKQDEIDLLNYLTILDSKGIKFALSNVIEHKGATHEMLEAWIREHNYTIHYITCDYNNSNYHKQEGNVTKTVEVLITNY